MNTSFQLYSAREFTPWVDIYEMLANLGYNQVEGFGANYVDATETKEQLDKNGLTMPTGHFFPIGSFEEELNSTLKAARVLQMERIFCPAPEDLWRNGTDAANWKSLAQRLEEACKKVNDAGFRFGWHNHHWEFIPLQSGEIPMEIILENAPSIEWEMDVAWVIRGDADPISWINRFGDRITTAHVKDIAPAGGNVDEDGWADPGHGTMDWKSCYSALTNVGVDVFVMEHDNPSNVSRFAKRAIETFKLL